MNKYLVKLTPLEPYFFSGENTFRIKGASPLESESYYISSLAIPAQPTVLGTLRYVLLEQNGLLNTDRVYPDRSKQNELIGEKPYMVDAESRLGKFISASPLFIMDRDDKMYIPTPLNHNATGTYYSPIELTETTLNTSDGNIRVPKKYDVKTHTGFMSENSYMCLSDRRIVNDLFESCVRVGIDKHKTDEAFFKKVYMTLKEGFSFAFEVTLDTELRDTVCYMGREKSCFRLEAVRIGDSESIEKKIETVSGNGVWYAFSDLVLKDKLSYTDYSVVKTGTLRTLSSSYGDDNKLKIRAGEKLYNVIKAGSVFYFDIDKELFYNDCYGLNRLVKLGE